MSNITVLLQAAQYFERRERGIIKKWQDLPDELILNILSYLEVKDLISCGQVSKRTRNISQDGSLWATVNLEKKNVKTELLEMILSKGCKILNLSDATIHGSLSSNIKSQLRVLDLSHSAQNWMLPTPRQADWGSFNNYVDQILPHLERLLISCSSLQYLDMSGLFISPKLVASICKNGKTLQVLNLNYSFIFESNEESGYRFDYTEPLSKFQEIIKCCQELKEIDLNYINEEGGSNHEGLTEDDLEFFTRNFPPDVEKLNLRSSCHRFRDYHVAYLLRRNNKIKALTLEANCMTDESFFWIKHLNTSLEELTLVAYEGISFKGFLKLKSMPKLKILNLYYKKIDEDFIAIDDEEIQNLRLHLPYMKIYGCTKGPSINNVSSEGEGGETPSELESMNAVKINGIATLFLAKPT